MKFFLEINSTKQLKLENPSAYDIKNALLTLNADSDDDFLILYPEDTVLDCEFIQCIKIDSYFHIEIKLKNLNNPRMFFYESEDIEKATKILFDFTNLILPELSYWQKDSLPIGEEDLVKEDDLCEIIKTKGLTPLKGCCIDCKNIIKLQTNYLESIINFAKENEIKNIFYVYKFADKNSFFLNYNDSRTLYNVAQNEVEKYQNTINKIDFSSRPAILELFCINNGFIVSASIKAFWLSTLPTAKDFAEELSEKYRDKISKVREEFYKKNEILKNELEQILLNNEEFSLCSNQKLRENFMNKFYSKLENIKYQDCFRYSDGNLSSYEIQKFTDTVYALVKQKLKKK